MGGDERSWRGESQESPRKCPFPRDLRRPALHQPTSLSPRWWGRAPSPLPRAQASALCRATCPPRPLRRRREPRGKATQHPAPAGRSRRDRAVSAVSLRDVGVGGRHRPGDNQRQGGETRRRGLWRRAGFEMGRKDEAAPTGQARPSRGLEGFPGPARAHLVTVRRARGLCALSRPRRAPMPASTSRAATPQTA